MKQLFEERGGYIRSSDNEKAVIEWKRGEDPRFELFYKEGGAIVLTEPLAGKSVRDIEMLLEKHGFEPVKRADNLP